MHKPPTLISELKDLADTGVIRYNTNNQTFELKAGGDHQYLPLDVAELTDSLPEGSPSVQDITEIEHQLTDYLTA